jgi:hypothetical protein
MMKPCQTLWKEGTQERNKVQGLKSRRAISPKKGRPLGGKGTTKNWPSSSCMKHLIYKFTTCVRDGARVCKSRRPGRGKNGIREKKNGIRKTGLVVRGKNGIRKNGIRKKRDSALSRSGPARQKLDHLCLCSAVATPELQARVCMPRVDVPDLFLFVAKMAIICRKMWKKWAILWKKI